MNQDYHNTGARLCTQIHFIQVLLETTPFPSELSYTIHTWGDKYHTLGHYTHRIDHRPFTVTTFTQIMNITLKMTIAILDTFQVVTDKKMYPLDIEVRLTKDSTPPISRVGDRTPYAS